jgi:hypothetical protein
MHKSTKVMQYVVIGVLLASIIAGFLVIVPQPWSPQARLNFWVSIAICLFNILFLVGIPSHTPFESMIPQFGILWVFDIVYTILAFLCMLLFSLVFRAIPIHIQILIHAILFAAFLSLGLWFSFAAGNQMREVAVKQRANTHFREIRAAFSQLVSQIQNTENRSELIQRIETDCDEFSFIAPCDTPQAEESLDVVAQSVAFLTVNWNKQEKIQDIPATLKRMETAIQKLRVSYTQ